MRKFAKKAGLSPSVVYQLVKSGQLPARLVYLPTLRRIFILIPEEFADELKELYADHRKWKRKRDATFQRFRERAKELGITVNKFPKLPIEHTIGLSDEG